MSHSISIIIPCYNGWRYFSKALESLENQTVLPDEIIIGDDCSTDDSFEKLEEYKNNSKLNIVLFRNEKNVGPGETRHSALKYITSDYVAFCDCDDWYELNFIESMKRIIDNEDSDLIIFDNYNITAEKRKANMTREFLNFDKNVALALYPMSLWRFIASVSIVRKVYFPPLYNGEDGAVAPQIICKAQNTFVTDEAFYNYLYRDNSASFKPDVRVCENLLKAFECVNEYVDDLYKKEKEFLGIKMVCYGATLNAFKAGISNKEIRSIIKKFKDEFPNWSHNEYICYLGKAKRIYLRFIDNRLLLLPRLMSMFHDFLAQKGVSL